MLQADTLDCKHDVKSAERGWESSDACWPDATRTDGIEALSDFLVGAQNEPTWDDETKPASLEASHCSKGYPGDLIRRKVAGVHA